MNSWLAQQQVQAEYDAQPLWQTETAQQRQGQRCVSKLAKWPIPVHPVGQLLLWPNCRSCSQSNMQVHLQDV